MKIHVTLDQHDRSNNRVVIDGQDITRHVLASDFVIDADPDGPTVTMILHPDALEVEGDLRVLVEAAFRPDAEASR